MGVTTLSNEASLKQRIVPQDFEFCLSSALLTPSRQSFFVPRGSALGTFCARQSTGSMPLERCLTATKPGLEGDLVLHVHLFIPITKGCPELPFVDSVVVSSER